MPCLGSSQSHRRVGAIDIAVMEATVPEHAVLAHEHEEAHLVLVLRGRYLSTAQDMPTELDVPALVFNPPGTRHRDRFAPGGGRFLTISVPEPHWASLSPRRRAQRRARRLPIDAMSSALLMSASLSGQRDTGSTLDVEAVIDHLLQRAADHPDDGARHAPTWFGRARDRLADPSGTTTLSDVAADCGVHAAQLSRAFRQFEGCTPGQFVRRHRLQRAAEQLARGRHQSLTDVALDAGFFDQAHFVRALRQEAGITPSHLRGLLRELRANEPRG